MAYSPQTWTDGSGGGTPISAARLGVIESGLQAAAAIADSAKRLTPTAVQTSAYTAAPGDLVRVDTTSAAVTVTLPTAPADMTQIAVKLEVQGGTNGVSIACGTGDHFNTSTGSTSVSLSLLRQTATFQYQTSTSLWFPIGGDLPLSQLDTRYMPVGISPIVANLVFGS